MSIFEYKGSVLIAMVGRNCFAIASDRRLGVQLQTVATDFQRILQIHDRLFVGLSGLATDAQTLSSQTEFIFNGFTDDSNLTLEESSIVKPNGVLKLTNRSINAIGHAFYKDPIQFFVKSNVSSFSTYFIFAIGPPGKDIIGGFGLAFTISPAKRFPGAEPGQHLGIFNAENDKNASNRVLALDFDTVDGFGSESENEIYHVGININSMDSLASAPAAYHIDANRKDGIDLEGTEPIQAWVHYDGTTHNITVTIAPINKPKPVEPLCFLIWDLSKLFNQDM